VDAAVSLVLYVGNRNYSSWSLRPWLCLRWAGLEFETRDVRLDQPGYGRQAVAEVLAVSPNGRLPCLHADGFAVWDSLAIAEWVAEACPHAALWPLNPQQRAEARSVTAEMHSGFDHIRQHLPMNLHRRITARDWDPQTREEIVRLDDILTGLRRRHARQGDWLFGHRGIADAFYAPMAARMRTYGVTLSPEAMHYCETLLADVDLREWEASCIADSWDSSGYSVIDGLYAGAD
jgi:glutathione S-transferase